MFSCKINSDSELRLLEDRHTEELYELVNLNREHIRKWSAWLTANHSLKDTRDFIKRSLVHFAEGKGVQAGIWYQGELAGQISLYRINWTNRLAEIGYWLSASHQGRGLITSSAKTLINHAFFEMRLNRLEMHCPIDNPRSRAIPEKLGFVEEGIRRQAYLLHDRFIDLTLYAMLAKDWKQ